MGDEDEKPAMQVVVLGSGGGPLENNTTSLLVRSCATEWVKGSLLAVDAGVHLSAIVKILEQHPLPERTEGSDGLATFTCGPFMGLQVPYVSAKANAGYITGEIINTYLITHPHLDHITGFVVNTASLPGPNSRPKTLAGLPATINAFKQHIFNNVIWPNLSDENNGAGLVTYMRLMDGGSDMLGDGEGKGYLQISEGLGVKTWSVSHGHCMEHHSHRGSTASSVPGLQPELSPRSVPRSPRADSIAGLMPAELIRHNSLRECVYDSSAYFIRDLATGREIIIFGDVEPDSLSLSPRNLRIWKEAAPMVVSNRLGGILIECSFDDSQSNDRLYGHLAPRFLIEELKTLADEVERSRNTLDDNKKRKRISFDPIFRRRSIRTEIRESSPVSPMSQPPRMEMELADGTVDPLIPEESLSVRPKGELPLKGVKVVIIHVKDRLNDGPEVGEVVLSQLLEYEKDAKLGCEFVISKSGQAVNF